MWDDGTDIFKIFRLKEIINEEFTLIKKEQKIDIQNIEELALTFNFTGNVRIEEKINSLIKAIKQLDKKIKE